MPGKYMEEAQRFKGDLRKAGFTVGMAQEFVQPIARELGVSVKHVQNMMCGHNRAGRDLVARIDELIKKNNGQNKSKVVSTSQVTTIESDQPYLTQKRLYMSHDLINPLVLEMSGAIQGAISPSPGSDPVVSVNAVRQWRGYLRKCMSEKD